MVMTTTWYIHLAVAAGWLIVVPLAIGRARSAQRRSLSPLAQLAVGCYGAVAIGALITSASGWTMFGIEEPIVELTAVHFLYAGIGATALADFAQRQHAGRLGWWALLATTGSPPIVALGFVSKVGPIQVGGAITMTIGVWCTSIILGQIAIHPTPPLPARLAFGVAALVPWVPMVLAVSWAAGQHWDVRALSIDAMIRTHGAANSTGFIIAGLVGRLLVLRTTPAMVDPVPAPV